MDTWDTIIKYIALVAYAVPAIIYATKIPHSIAEGHIFEAALKAILVLGFALVSYMLVKHIIRKRNGERNEQTGSIVLYATDPPADMGYALLAIYFVLIITPTTPLYYLLGIAAYAALAARQTIGLYLMVLFYIISIVSRTDMSFEGNIMTLSKVLLIIYLSTYIYIDLNRFSTSG